LAAGSSGLEVIDFTDPASPVKVGGYDDDTQGNANALALAGRYAYVADGYSGMHVIDISNPASPVRMGGFDNTYFGNAYDVAVAGNYAYVANERVGLVIYAVGFRLTGTVVGGHGTLQPTAGTYFPATVVPLTAVPDAGYKLKAWTGTDSDLSNVPTNTVTMTADRTVTAEFEPCTSGDDDADGVANCFDLCAGTAPGIPVDVNGCPALVPGDFNRDGDVDMEDFGHLQSCLGELDSAPSAGCVDADLDANTRVGLSDLARFQDCLSGPNTVPKPSCVD
jgi:hypothetical protein